MIMFAKLVGSWRKAFFKENPLMNQDYKATAMFASAVDVLFHHELATYYTLVLIVKREYIMLFNSRLFLELCFYLLQVETGSCICHSCWVTADRTASRAASHVVPGSTMPSATVPSNVRHNQSESTIILPDYMRAVETESRCFIEGCQRKERNRVPVATRKMLLSNYNYYVPENNRLCDRHLTTEEWDFLNSMTNNNLKIFTAKHVEDMLSLK